VIDGTYLCEDSNPSTWSTNTAAGGRGFCKVWGVPAQAITTESTTTVSTTTTKTTTTSPKTTTSGGGGSTTSESPCTCARFVFHISSTKSSYNRAAGISTVTMQVGWSLYCTGGTSKDECYGAIQVISPADAMSTNILDDLPAGENITTVNGIYNVEVQCSGKCGLKRGAPTRGSFVIKSQFANALAGRTFAYQFKTECEKTKTQYLYTLAYDSGGTLIPPSSKNQYQRLRTVTLTGVTKCKCDGLTMTPLSTEVVKKNVMDGAGDSSIRFPVDWTLHCSGGFGTCGGSIEVLPHGSSADMRTSIFGPDGTSGLVALVTCRGPCGGETSNHFYVETAVPGSLGNDTFRYDFVVVCSNHKTYFEDLTFAFNSHGTVTVDRVKEVKVPPPPPPPPPPLKTKCKCVKMTLSVAPTLLAGKKLPPTGLNFGVSFNWAMTCSTGEIRDCKGDVYFYPPTILAGSLPRLPNGLRLRIVRRQFHCNGLCNKSQTGSFQILMSSKSQLNQLFGRVLAFTIKYGCPGAPLATFRANIKISKTGVMS
jgi:hypothetical protein